MQHFSKRFSRFSRALLLPGRRSHVVRPAGPQSPTPHPPTPPIQILCWHELSLRPTRLVYSPATAFEALRILASNSKRPRAGHVLVSRLQARSCARSDPSFCSPARTPHQSTPDAGGQQLECGECTRLRSCSTCDGSRTNGTNQRVRASAALTS